MNRPLLGIIAMLLIAAIILQSSNLLTGAATTQSFVTILPPTPTPTPPSPPAPEAPAAPAIPPAPMPAPEELYYIGDFATQQAFEHILMDLHQVWIFTFKNENHTIQTVSTNTNYADFIVESSTTRIRIYVGSTVWLDADGNDLPDVKLTLNKIEGTKVDITLELPPEAVTVFKYVYVIPDYVYLLLALLVLAIIYMYRERERHKRSKKS